MNKQERVALAIKEVVSKMMDRVMENVLMKDPFIKEKHHSSKPLYAALVPDEIFKGSHFERRFVTPFGRVWERLAQVVASSFLLVLLAIFLLTMKKQIQSMLLN
jgi:hypothetical protein